MVESFVELSGRLTSATDTRVKFPRYVKYIHLGDIVERDGRNRTLLYSHHMDGGW